MAERPLRWVITGYKHGWLGNDLYIKVQVDPPTKLYLHHSIIPPKKHAVATPIRGTSRLHWPNFCFEEFSTIRNIECTDVAENSFIIPGWTLGQKRWWLFSGTRGGVPTKSISGICSHTAFEADEAERPRLPGDVDLIHRELWTGPSMTQPPHLLDFWDFGIPHWHVQHKFFVSPPTGLRIDSNLPLPILCRHGDLALNLISGEVFTFFMPRWGPAACGIAFYNNAPFGSAFGENGYAVHVSLTHPTRWMKWRAGLWPPDVTMGRYPYSVHGGHWYGARVRWVFTPFKLTISVTITHHLHPPWTVSSVDLDPWHTDSPIKRAGLHSLGGSEWPGVCFDNTEVAGVAGDWPAPCP